MACIASMSARRRSACVAAWPSSAPLPARGVGRASASGSGRRCKKSATSAGFRVAPVRRSTASPDRTRTPWRRAASSRSSGNTPCPGSNHCISRTPAMSGRTPRVMLPFAAAVTAAHADPVSHALPTDHHHSRCVRLRSRAPAGAQSAGCAGERSVPSRLRRPRWCASRHGSRRAPSRPPPGRRWCRSPTTCCAGPRR